MSEEKKAVSQPQEEKRPYEECFYWLQTLVTAIVCIVLAFTFLGRITRVVGSSMTPTLRDGEMMLVWSLGYTPKAGDIVVLTQPSYQKDSIVKRVIATGGQTVRIDYNTATVYVDGVPLEEDYIKERMRVPSFGLGNYDLTVPEGSIFVMGDNRNNSTDSRRETIGCVDTRYIMGKVIFRILPFSSVGAIYGWDY